MNIQEILIIEDIFTNIFLRSNIHVIHNLIFINKTFHKYCLDLNLWKNKFKRDNLFWINDIYPRKLIERLKEYHDQKATVSISEMDHDSFVSYGDCDKLAYVILNTALVELSINSNEYHNIYVKIPHGKQLIFNLLGEIYNRNYRKCNVITLHTYKNMYKNNYQISFRQLNYKQLDESNYKITKDDIYIKLSYSALLHYLTVILYNNRYTQIVDINNLSYIEKDLIDGSKNAYQRLGTINTFNYIFDNS